jgi:hypothetical protein
MEKLNKEIDAIVAEPNMKARLVGLGPSAYVIDIRRIRKIHCRPDRQVGQGDPDGQHQAGVIR